LLELSHACALTLLLLLFYVAGTRSLFAHDPISTKLTWSREISRIVYARCVECHREGGSAPMALVSYQQARPWAKAIKEQVLNRQMPPWGAVKGFADFRNDRGLSQEEISLIAAWVEGGAPEGDPSLVPELPPAAQKDRDLNASRDGLQVTGRGVLSRDAVVLAVEPFAPANISSARVEAILPDGRVEQLIWLFDYRKKFDVQFEYREPLALPRGTTVVSQPPVTVQLLLK
jgi:hypothetical protein